MKGILAIPIATNSHCQPMGPIGEVSRSLMWGRAVVEEAQGILRRNCYGTCLFNHAI